MRWQGRPAGECPRARCGQSELPSGRTPDCTPNIVQAWAHCACVRGGSQWCCPGVSPHTKHTVAFVRVSFVSVPLSVSKQYRVTEDRRAQRRPTSHWQCSIRSSLGRWWCSPARLDLGSRRKPWARVPGRRAGAPGASSLTPHPPPIRPSS